MKMNPISRRGFLQTAAAASLATAARTTAETRKIKVGVIGCGSVSGSYLPVLAASPYVELVSACDLILERAQARAQKFNIPNVYPNIDEMLKGPKFEFLVNLTSMPSHYPVNLKGLQAGLNVWSEKPLSVHSSDARKLVALAQEKKLGFWGAPITILSPQFKFMAETLASGKLGKVTAAHAHYGHEGFLWSAWFFQKGGGSLYDLGVYNVTTLTGLFGPAKAVVGMTSICTPTRKLTDGTEVKVEVSDNDMLIMEHANGVLSHVQSGYNYGSADGHSGKTDMYTIDLFGTQGDMHLCGYDWGPHGVDVATLKEPRKRYVEDPAGYQWQIGAAHIAECLATGKPTIMSMDHAYHVLEVMEGCHISAQTGKRVPLNSTFKWPIFS
jgi:predicted dehydrogenase